MHNDSPGNTFKSISEILTHNKSTYPQKIAYRFLLNDIQNETITYEELYNQVFLLAYHMQKYIAPLDRVILSARPGLDFIIGFYACLLTRTIAIPVIPPADQMTAIRFATILNNSSPKLILFDKKTAQTINFAKKANTFMPNILKSLLGIHEAHTQLFNIMEHLSFHILYIDGHKHFPHSGLNLPECEPEDVAFLQYTSGSVGTPKGVMITHANLLHNLEIIRKVIHCSVDSKMFSWLPPYHDMGLIAGIIEPFYTGSTSIIMSPLDFLDRPSRWVENISKYQCTLTGAPNFAFELCALKTDDKLVKTLDLSPLEVAANGAEPIHISAMNAFYKKFTQAGLRKGVILPCYGLAESTVMVSGKQCLTDDLILSLNKEQFKKNKVCLSTENQNPQVLVSSGVPQLNVKIVNPETLICCPDNEIGEIWIQGNSVSPGYFDNEVETEATFHAYIQDDPIHMQYLRSGDLGFIYDGNLFVCGRVKNMIIISGQNYYPQDIERATIEADPAIRRGCVVAYASHFSSREGITIVAEIRSKTPKKNFPVILENIKRGIGLKFHLVIHEIILSPPRTIPKTLSGKLQRLHTKNAVIEGSMPIIHYWKAPEFSDSNEVELEILLETSAALNPENWIISWIAHHLHQPKEQLSLETPFIVFGLDSIAISQLIHDLNKYMGIHLDPKIVWSYPSPNQLLNYIHNNKSLEKSTHITHQANQKSYQLSPEQEHLWFTASISPEQKHFNLGCAYTLKGVLNRQRLKIACLQTVNKHAVLKTLVKNTAQGPKAIIAQHLKDVFKEIRIPSHQSQDLIKQIAEETSLPYDLSKGNLIRIRLFHRQSASPVLLIAVHHLVFDGFSMYLFMKDLIAAYDGLQKEGHSTAVHYYDYAIWQRKQLKTDQHDEALNYWINHLNQAPTYLNLPLDNPRNPGQNPCIKPYEFKISIPLSTAINNFCKNQNITPFILFFSAFQILLSHYAQQKDFVVGVPVNTRNLAEISTMVGFFINTLPIRVQLENPSSISEFLQENQKKLMHSYHHQKFSLTDLFSALALERQFSYEPLFQVLFVMQNLFVDQIKGKEIEATPFWWESGQSNHDLVIEIIPGINNKENPNYEAILKYNANLFNISTIKRMMEHFKILLKNILSHPKESALSITYMNEKEIEQCLNQYNQTYKQYPSQLSIGHLFLKQVQETPDNIAIKTEEGALTYKALDEQTNQLSHYLINNNIKANQIIAVSLPRSSDLVICLIAIAKIGGTFFYLDPDYPLSLQEKLLRDTQAVMHMKQINKSAYAHLSTINPNIAIDPNTLAYILFTSGSTSTPKGVMVTYGNLLDRMNWYKNTEINVDRFLHLFSFNFDGAVAALWWPLIKGGAVILTNTLTQTNIPLNEFIDQEKITVIHATPGFFEGILSASSSKQLKTIQDIVLAGEAFPISLRNKITKKLPHNTTRIWNFYGPTEGTIISTCYRINHQEQHNIPIGKPVANTCCYILDDNRNPVPLGVSGQLYISGKGVSLGYMNQPVLTAEKFISNPWCKDEKLYATGDKMRWNDRGNLEFLGRIDKQVKVHGYRIELSAIELTCIEYPGVEQAIAIAREDKPGQKRIVVYIKAKTSDAARLKDYLSSQLPQYAVPACIVYLDKIPLTNNGKIDFNQLPKPNDTMLKHTFESPKTEIEIKLANIWAKVLDLNINQVNINDSFFDMGGNSILSIHCLAQAKQQGLSIKPQDLFQYKTIKAISKHIQGSVHKQNAVPAASPKRKSLITKMINKALLKHYHPNAGNIIVEGIEHVTKGKPLIIATNHLSWIDLIRIGPSVLELLGLSDQKPHILSAWSMRCLHPITALFVDPIYLHRNNSSENITQIEQCIENIKKGKALLISPEGKRNSNKLREGKGGVSYIAIQSATDVLPIAIYKTKDKKWQITIKPAIKTDHLPCNIKTMHELTQLIMQTIATMLPDEHKGFYL